MLCEPLLIQHLEDGHLATVCPFFKYFIHTETAFMKSNRFLQAQQSKEVQLLIIYCVDLQNIHLSADCLDFEQFCDILFVRKLKRSFLGLLTLDLELEGSSAEMSM